MNKLLRLVEVPALVSQVEQAAIKGGIKVDRNFLRVSKLMFIVFFVSHTFACGFFLIAWLERSRSSCDNWADQAGVFSDCNRMKKETRKCEEVTFDKVDAYVYAMNWAVATLTTVGYGDIHAFRGSMEVVFSIVAMMVGTFGVYSQVIANLDEIVAQLDVTESLFKRRVERLQRACERVGLPSRIALKVDGYLETLWIKQCGVSSQAVIGYLPVDLRSEVMSALLGNAIHSLFFFRDCSPQAIHVLVASLRYEYFGTGHALYRTGEPAQRLYFLGRRSSARFFEEGTNFTFTTVQGGVVGESEFLARKTFPCGAEMCAPADVFLMNFDEFWAVLLELGLSTFFSSKLPLGLEELEARSTDALIDKVRSNMKTSKVHRLIEIKVPSRANHWVICSSSIVYQAWKTMALILILYSCATVPLFLAFESAAGPREGGQADRAIEFTKVAPSAEAALVSIEIISILFFSCDMAFHVCFFARKHDGRLVTDPREFRRLYARACLPCDLMATLPAPLLVYSSGSGSFGALYAALRLGQLLRIARVSEYSKIAASLVGNLVPGILPSASVRCLVGWGGLVVLLNHWVACAFVHECA